MFRLVVCYPGMGREELLNKRTKEATEKILSESCGKEVVIMTTEFDLPMAKIDPITLNDEDRVYLYLVDYDSYTSALEKSAFWGRSQVNDLTRFVFPSLNVNDYAEIMKYLKKKVKYHTPIYHTAESNTTLSDEYRHYSYKLNYVGAYFSQIGRLIDKIKDHDDKYYMVKMSSGKKLLNALEAICTGETPTSLIPMDYLNLIIGNNAKESVTSSIG